MGFGVSFNINKFQEQLWNKDKSGSLLLITSRELHFLLSDSTRTMISFDKHLQLMILRDFLPSGF